MWIRLVAGGACALAGALLLRRSLPLALALLGLGVFLMVLPARGDRRTM